jgi:signal transduction histidine kinase
MSHELRTPLNAIGGYLDLLDLEIHGPFTDEQREAFASIKRNQNHLLVVINDLLNFAQLEAGKIEYEMQTINMAAFLAEIHPLLETHATARRISFTMERAPAGLRALGDPDRLHQVLLNLVGNAAKFTAPGGSIRIWCEMNEQVVALRVRDTGRGIPGDKLDTIFDPFVQVDRKNSPATEKGVGLGLAISRDLARGMGGDLKVSSTPGNGSTFTLELRRVP